MKKGQTVITLLVFIAIAVTLTTGAIFVGLTNFLTATKIQQGEIAYFVAESGIENALLRLLRNPNYSGETLPVGEGTATVTVNGTPKTVISEGKVGNFSRKIKVIVDDSGYTLSILFWKEVQ